MSTLRHSGKRKFPPCWPEPKTPLSTSTPTCDSATPPRMSSGPIVASRPTSGWYFRDSFLSSLESLSIGLLDQPVQFLGCEHCPLSELEQCIQQDRSQRHYFRKQSLFGGNGLCALSGACLRQEHLTAPLAQRQTVALGYSDKLFVLAHRIPGSASPRPCGFLAAPTHHETALGPTSTPFRRGRT